MYIYFSVNYFGVIRTIVFEIYRRSYSFEQPYTPDILTLEIIYIIIGNFLSTTDSSPLKNIPTNKDPCLLYKKFQELFD